VGDIEQDAGLELVIGTLGYDVLAVLQFNRIVHLDLQVDMVALWMSGKDGLEAVVASGLSDLGAALENRESIVKAVYENGILLLCSRQRMNSTSMAVVHDDVVHR
jgi:hypothetical protein